MSEDITKEDIFNKFADILKENPEGIEDETIRRIEHLEVSDLEKIDQRQSIMRYKLICNGESFGGNLYTSNKESAESLAMHIYNILLKDYDPQENDPREKDLIRRAGKEAGRKLRFKFFFRRRMGGVHIFWDLKKKILREKYGIDWKTPAERNPEVKYD